MPSADTRIANLALALIDTRSRVKATEIKLAHPEGFN